MTPLDIAKFWMYVEVDKSTRLIRTAKKWLGYCWIWKGHLFQNGYGHYSLHQKAYKAHRVAFFLNNGDIPKGMYVCHICDNTKCVNPEHLFVGTPKDNTLDMIAKGRLIKFRSKRKIATSKYLGVSFRKDNGKWKASIMRNYQVVWRSQFDTEEEANRARIEQLERMAAS